MRALVTGAGGFVGPYVCDALRQVVDGSVEIVRTALAANAHAIAGPLLGLDVTDAAAVESLVERQRPDWVVHLAGIAAPAEATADWGRTWSINLTGTLNLAHAILRHAPDCVLLFAGSGQVYGASARSGRPMDERTLLAPIDDYSASKAAADLALGAMADRGLRAIRMRPFNHTGPGQNESFFVPSIAMQIARIEAGLQPPILRVGNLEAERDFLDVRDVANAYALAIRNADTLPPGTVLNVASGRRRRMRDVLERLVASSPATIAIEKDLARLRRSDLPCIVGDPSLSQRLLGWTPCHEFEETLANILTHSREIVTFGRD
ncbi:NAD-dependent epimerase/dehydratase family protein [Rhodoplanes serenus]|uniref:NAD-dependent epimerase/dehydratase family protein n=1 Tax=Rhodoplanes serenus TaxID=200615 RepID=UPI000DACB1B5|nr:NAD-dependent epimerase/dehydratase family protein [Rhodoplanes serenus]RAI37021.1 oxidoreductase [Rhodoplanes serenus]